MTMPTLSDFGIDPSLLSEEEVASLASDLLTYKGMPHKIWVREDVECVLDDARLEGITEQNVERIVEHVWTGSGIGLLSDCTDTDWEIIRHNIRNAAEELGIKL